MNRDKKYAYAIGVGVALFAIHNKWLAETTAYNGDAVLFLPAFGAVIWILATLFFLRDNYKMDWGEKRIWIPLLVIVAAIGLSGITADTIGGKFAPILMGSMLFSLYLVSRKLGKDIFTPLAIGAAIASVGVIISGIIWRGQLTGGLVFEHNYDIAIGYIILGTIFYQGRFSSILRSVAIIAVFLTGAPEGVFAGFIILLFVLIRKDWGKSLVQVVIPVIIVAIIWFSCGWGQQLYYYSGKVAGAMPGNVVSQITSSSATPPNANIVDGVEPITENALGVRLEVIVWEMKHLRLLGEGFNLTAFEHTTVHNVPLIIVQQLGFPGIIAAIAWLWLALYGLVKTKWKYAWIAILALSLFDHFTWDQLAPVFPILLGISTVSTIKSDLMFREDNAD
jgi:hypothetical protein